jgi:hypothetical protein
MTAPGVAEPKWSWNGVSKKPRLTEKFTLLATSEMELVPFAALGVGVA